MALAEEEAEEIGYQAAQRISGHCGKRAHEMYQLAMDLHEHQLDIMRTATAPRKAKSEILFQMNSNIDTIGEYYPETEERAVVIKELSTIRDQVASLPSSQHERIVMEAAEGYERLVHKVLLPVMLDRFAECECETRRGHLPSDQYMPAADEVRMRLLVLKEMQ